MPKMALQIFPQTGHLNWSDQPEMFAAMIIDWVTTGTRTSDVCAGEAQPAFTRTPTRPSGD